MTSINIRRLLGWQVSSVQAPRTGSYPIVPTISFCSICCLVYTCLAAINNLTLLTCWIPKLAPLLTTSSQQCVKREGFFTNPQQQQAGLSLDVYLSFSVNMISKNTHFPTVLGCGAMARWLEHSCAKREALCSIPSCTAWFFSYPPSQCQCFLSSTGVPEWFNWCVYPVRISRFLRSGSFSLLWSTWPLSTGCHLPKPLCVTIGMCWRTQACFCNS